MKLVSWQSTLSEHQVHLMRALHKQLGGALKIVVGARLLTERSAQGWTEANTDGLDVSYLPETSWWAEGRALIEANQDAFHLFGGLWADRRFLPLILHAQRKGVNTGLMTEPYSEAAVSYFGAGQGLMQRIKLVLRPIAYNLAGFMLGRHLKALFAISTLAVKQFTEAGFSVQSIYPFGYFVPKTPVFNRVQPEKIDSSAISIRLVFVGSLIERKGLSLMFAAFRSVSKEFESAGVSLTLDIYGSGSLSSTLDLPAGVKLKGLIPFGEAQKVIALYDALVLPSLHDGWGVVVNEALLQGVPAIVSDAVGAQALVAKSGAGVVFPSGSSDALANCFRIMLKAPDQLLSWKIGAENIGASLDPNVAASYLIACLRHASGTLQVRPLEPWYP